MAISLKADNFASFQSATQDAWAECPDTKEAALAFLVERGRAVGYKNVFAAMQGRVPKHIAKAAVEAGETEQSEEEVA